ncbi:MAG: hypothetical protein ACYSU0_22840, partial [Planctomycetota bacterium]
MRLPDLMFASGAFIAICGCSRSIPVVDSWALVRRIDDMPLDSMEAYPPSFEMPKDSVIRDEEGWRAHWATLKKPPPPVDFIKHMVMITVGWATSPREITAIVAGKGYLTVHQAIRVHPPESPVVDDLSVCQWVFAKIPKSDLLVRWQTTTYVGDEVAATSTSAGP